MPRKTLEVTISEEGRDKDKVFVITEMPAAQAEKWAMRGLMALARSGVDLPENVENAGIAGIAALGIKALAGMPWEMAEPLMDEMFTCIKIMPDPKNPGIVRALVPDDIEEIATRVKLRFAAFELHTGFSLPDVASTSKSTPSGQPLPASQATVISRPLSAPSSRRARPV